MRGAASSTSHIANEIIANAREFIPGRLYFAWQDYFPKSSGEVFFFTVDNRLMYAPFFNDFGPNSMAQVTQFCEILKDVATNPANAGKKICLVSSLDGDKKANSAFLISAYMMFVEGKTPDEAWKPMAHDFDRQIPSYRDAGYGNATFFLTIPDILRGLYKAQSYGLLHLHSFDREEYEWFEKVENGDFNWICDKFIAIASPSDERVSPLHGHIRMQRTPQSSVMDLLAAREATVNASVSTLVASHGNGQSNGDQNNPWGKGRQRRQERRLYSCYTVDEVVRYFKDYGVAAMVRLNNRLYDRKRFLDAGIMHHELYFPDGTTPPEKILQKFLEIAENTPGPIAVHCKAGLGRTGSLIACYLMKHYHFTAPEVIGFLRVLRPGSIVGPQQNWLISVQQRMWKLKPAMPLPGYISMLRQPSFVTVSKKVDEAVQRMQEMAEELDHLTGDNMDLDEAEKIDVSKLAIPKQPRKPTVAQAAAATGPIRRSKSQLMQESLDSMQITNSFRITKHNKVRPMPKIDTTVPNKPTVVAASASPSSSGTLIGGSPHTISPRSSGYSLRNSLLNLFGANSTGEAK